jgi:hypothetical protein
VQVGDRPPHRFDDRPQDHRPGAQIRQTRAVVAVVGGNQLVEPIDPALGPASSKYLVTSRWLRSITPASVESCISLLPGFAALPVSKAGRRASLTGVDRRRMARMRTGRGVILPFVHPATAIAADCLVYGRQVGGAQMVGVALMAG